MVRSPAARWCRGRDVECGLPRGAHRHVWRVVGSRTPGVSGGLSDPRVRHFLVLTLCLRSHFPPPLWPPAHWGAAYPAGLAVVAAAAASVAAVAVAFVEVPAASAGVPAAAFVGAAWAVGVASVVAAAAAFVAGGGAGVSVGVGAVATTADKQGLLPSSVSLFSPFLGVVPTTLDTWARSAVLTHTRASPLDPLLPYPLLGANTKNSGRGSFPHC